MLTSRLFSRSIIKSVSPRSNFTRLQRKSTFPVDLAYTCSENNRHDNSQTPVIILHGFLASKTSWSSFSEAVHQTTGKSVINVDARDHGESPQTSECSYVNMVHDVVNLMGKLDLPKVTLLGHSMGGRTAMLTSLLYPKKVSGLIVVDISPASFPEQATNFYPPLLHFLTTLDFEGITNIEEGTRFIKEKLYAFGVTQNEIINLISNNVGMKPDNMVGLISNVQTLNECFPMLLKFPRMPEKIYPGPALFIGAGETDFLPPEDLHEIKSLFPEAQLKYVPGVRHNVHEEDPSTLLRLTTEFIIKHNI